MFFEIASSPLTCATLHLTCEHCCVRGHFMSFLHALGRLAILKKLPEEQSRLGLELAHLILWGQECEPPTFHIHGLNS